MTELQPVATLPQLPSPGAQRMARHRRRGKKDMRCLTVELRETEIDALIRRQRLAPESRGDLLAVRMERVNCPEICIADRGVKTRTPRPLSRQKKPPRMPEAAY